MMKEMRLCKRCGIEKELKYFYKRKNKSGFYKPTGSCKHCLGNKNPDKVLYKKTDEIKPSKEELKAFIREMNYKIGHFDFIDSLRLIDIFTRQNGLVFTNLSVEEELMYMWEKLKEQNEKNDF